MRTAHADIVGDLQPAPGGTNYLGTFDIVINAGPGLMSNAAALAAFNRAAAQWEAYISDPITVIVNADLASLDPGVLGEASSAQFQGSYATIRNAMHADALDEPDDTAAQNLPASYSPSLFTLPAGFGTNGNLQLTKANAKALGLSVSGGPDGSISFSTNFNFDFDRSNGITAGHYDFETVAAHEIGHILGFVSSVDTVDFLMSQMGTSMGIQPTTVDMFRFDVNGQNPADMAEFNTFARSLVPGGQAVFDQIDGSFGGLVEVPMATGVSNGDGRQASHWKDNLGLGIFDPTLGLTEISLITANDLRLLDLIGYEIAAIPEIGGLAMLSAVSALSAVVVRVRRRRLKKI